MTINENTMKRIILIFCLTAALASWCATPEYVNTNANHIDINGADWHNLAHKFAEAKSGNRQVNILHIGDSHIQAEFVTNRLRQLIQGKYGNAGRGLMVPLRLAGTNQSNDYNVTATPGTEFVQTRLLKCPWPVDPGFAGVAALPQQDTRLTWKTTGPGHTIANATLFTSEGMKRIYPDNNISDSIITPIKAGEAVYGLFVDNGSPGVIYSAIGNNGATYNDYLLVPGLVAATAELHPDMIVLSMGTNEAFSTMTDNQIVTAVTNLVKRLRRQAPDADFLMLLPMECQKNRNHGYRPLSPDYDILQRNAEIAALLKKTSRELGIPSWDFYTIAGGEGVSQKWIDDKLMNKDRIHLLRPGYELQAELLFLALDEQLQQ